MYRIYNNIFLPMVGFSFCMCMSACQKNQEIPISKQFLKLGALSNNSGMDFKPFGLINESDAVALYNTYHLSHPSDFETQFVAFKIKDLIGYLNILSNKNQGDEVYVCFGQYSEQTINDPNKIGRTTIFFSGNTAFQNQNSKEVYHSKLVNDYSEYLNHGQLYP